MRTVQSVFIFSRRRPAINHIVGRPSWPRTWFVRHCAKPRRAAETASARADLQRILELAGEWRSSRARANAIFACGGRNIWREVDLPPQLGEDSTVRQPPLPSERTCGCAGCTTEYMGGSCGSPAGSLLRSASRRSQGTGGPFPAFAATRTGRWICGLRCRPRRTKCE